MLFLLLNFYKKHMIKQHSSERREIKINILTTKQKINNKLKKIIILSSCILAIAPPLFNQEKTEAYSYGSWSDWSTTKPSSATGRQIEQTTRYYYRDKTFTDQPTSSYSGWTATGYKWNKEGAWAHKGAVEFNICSWVPNHVNESWGGHNNAVVTQEVRVETYYWYGSRQSNAGWALDENVKMNICGTTYYWKYSDNNGSGRTVYDRHRYARTVTPMWEFYKYVNGGAWTYTFTNPGAHPNGSAWREQGSETVYRYRDIYDVTAPTGSCWIENHSRDGYDVVCNVYEENSGLSEVKFPTWTNTGGMNDIIWIQGTLSNIVKNSDGVIVQARASARINRSSWGKWDTYVTRPQFYDNKDNRGILSDIYTDLKDTTPPTASISLSHTTWTNQNVVATLTGADDSGGSGFAALKYRLNGGGWSGDLGNGAKVTISNEGTHTIEVQSRDNSGNTSPIVSAKIYIDKSAPKITEASTSPNTWTNGAVNVYAKASDTGGSGVSKIQTNINGWGWVDHSGDTVNKTLLTDHNSYTVQIRAVDNAGTYSNIVSVNAYIDTVKPGLIITPDTTDLTTQSFNVTINATDNDSKINRIQLHNGNIVYADNATYHIPANGDYTFRTWDNANNMTEKTISITNIRPIYEGVHSPIEIFYYLEGATTSEWAAIENGGKVWITNEGITTLYAEAEDEAGNVSTEKHTVIKIDLTKPEVTASHDTTWTNQNVTVNVTATDNIGVAHINTYTDSINTSNTLSSFQPRNNSKTLAIFSDNSYESNIDTWTNELRDKFNNLTTTMDKDLNSSIPATNYDLIIYIGYVWTPSEKAANYMNNAYIGGKSVLSFGNDANSSLAIIDSNSAKNGEYSFGTADTESYFYEIGEGVKRSDGYQAITIPSEVRVLATLNHYDGTSSPGILRTNNESGGEWLHFQSSSELIKSTNVSTFANMITEKNVTLNTTLETSFVATDNGVYPITVYDVAGNKKVINHVVSNIDRIKPTTTISTNPGCWTNSDSVDVMITSIDKDSQPDRIEYSLSGATTQSTTSVKGNVITFQIKNDGITTITARSYDKAGNVSIDVTETVCIDRIPPSINSFSASPTVTNNSNIELLLNGSDTLSGVGSKQFKRNEEEWGNWTPYDGGATTVNTTVKTEGFNTFYARIRDKASNVSDIAQATILYDITGPEILDVKINPEFTNKDVIQVKVSAKDNFEDTGLTHVKRIELSNDGTNWTSYTATNGSISVDWTIPLINGYRDLYVRAYDNLENRGATTTQQYVVDTIKPTGSIIIDKGQDYITNEETEIHLNFSDILNGIPNLSGVAKLKVFDVNGSHSYVVNNPEGNDLTLDWVLHPYGDIENFQKAQVGVEITDKAGNSATVYSKEVTISKIVIKEFHLTNVINPEVYNTSNPFIRLSYPNIPSQPLVSGGSFNFETIYIHPPLSAIPGWTVTKIANITYIGPDGFNETYTITQERESIDGVFESIHEIPFHIPKDTDVYIDIQVKLFDNNGQFMNDDVFPKPSGTKLKIGEIKGDIREQIKFNETS